MQPVGDLHQDDPDVAAHGQEHLAQIFHLLLFLADILHPRQLGHALHQFGHRRGEELCDLLVGGVGVLDAVVEQGRHDGLAVQVHIRHDLRHRQGVGDIGRAVLAPLVDVLFPGIFIGAAHFLKVRVAVVGMDGGL